MTLSKYARKMKEERKKSQERNTFFQPDIGDEREVFIRHNWGGEQEEIKIKDLSTEKLKEAARKTADDGVRRKHSIWIIDMIWE